MWAGMFGCPLPCTTYRDHLDNGVLLVLWQHYGDDPFLIYQTNAPIHKLRSINDFG